MSHDGERVLASDLLHRPLDFDGRRITTEGLFQKGMESSALAGAWLAVPEGSMWGSPAPQGQAHFVRVTGTWRARPSNRGRGGFGHMGLWNQCLFAERIDAIEMTPSLFLRRGQLPAILADTDGKLVEAAVSVVLGHDVCTVDGVALLGARCLGIETLPSGPPQRRPARIRAWVQQTSLTVVGVAWEGPPVPEPIPSVRAADLPRHNGQIVHVTGRLTMGAYWPMIGPCELVPPEIATTHLKHYTFGRSDPPPAAVLAWREHLAKASDGLFVEARGTVIGEGAILSAFELEML